VRYGLADMRAWHATDEQPHGRQLSNACIQLAYDVAEVLLPVPFDFAPQACHGLLNYRSMSLPFNGSIGRRA
jgi:hypothetical protein